MADTERESRREVARTASRASTRVAELKDRIEQAAKLIGELRESNYSLSGEVAELRRELESASARRSEPEREGATSGDSDADELQIEVDALRNERATIRTKVVQLLERIEKLES